MKHGAAYCSLLQQVFKTELLKFCTHFIHGALYPKWCISLEWLSPKCGYPAVNPSCPRCSMVPESKPLAVPLSFRFFEITFWLCTFSLDISACAKGTVCRILPCNSFSVQLSNFFSLKFHRDARTEDDAGIATRSKCRSAEQSRSYG